MTNDFSTMNKTLQDLFSRRRGSIKPGLERMHRFVRALDLHLGLPAVVVAGTNGKGSVSHGIASILHAHGLRVGLYTSPHLLHFRERFWIDGRAISEKACLKRAQEVIDCDKKEAIGASFFECATAMAFKLFEDNDVDVMILEVGLGGRWDAVNCVWPVASVITSVGLDHCDYLGDSETAIAREKAGIIKRGTPVFVGQCAHEVERVIAGEAQTHRAAMIKGDYSAKRLGDSGFRFRAQHCDFVVASDVQLADFQISNAALATRVSLFLSRQGLFDLVADRVNIGLRQPLPCRNERRVVQDVPMIIDVAHNVSAIDAIVDHLDSLGRTARVMFCALQDKMIPQMLDRLKHSKVILYPFSCRDSRSWKKQDAAATGFVYFYATPEAAFAALKQDLSIGEQAVVTGSFVAIGEFLEVCGQNG